MKRKVLAIALMMVVCMSLVGCQNSANAGNDVNDNMNTEKESEMLVEDTATVEYPIDITTEVSVEKTELISDFILAATGVANVEEKLNKDDLWGGSSAEISDYDKTLLYYFLMDKHGFAGLDSFEEAGLLEEAVDAYNVSTEQWISAIEYMFKGDCADDDKVMEFFIDNNGELRVPVSEDGVYSVSGCFEPVLGKVDNLVITQTSPTTISVEANVDSYIGLFGGLFNVYMEAELNEESPLAGITVTNIQVHCTETMDHSGY